jgi:serine/threonine protein kinase
MRQREVGASQQYCIDGYSLCLFVGVQILLALEFLHSMGIVHRDLKPSNIIFGADHRWKLIDFECATRVSHKSPAPLTLPYAAPELVCHEGGCIVETSSDMFSFGIIVYELISGGGSLLQGIIVYKLISGGGSSPLWHHRVISGGGSTHSSAARVATSQKGVECLCPCCMSVPKPSRSQMHGALPAKPTCAFCQVMRSMAMRLPPRTWC